MKRIPRLNASEKYKLLEGVLRGMTKPKLIAELELAKIPECWHTLENRLDLQPQTADDLICRTKMAINLATDYDERQINHNFDYDYDAYERIKRYFKQLIKMGQLAAAMKLAEDLMRDGSEQVEMSDEGLMWDDIEECLDIVFDAAEKSGMAEEQIAAWAARLQQADRVGLYRRAEEFGNTAQGRPGRRPRSKKN